MAIKSFPRLAVPLAACLIGYGAFRLSAVEICATPAQQDTTESIPEVTTVTAKVERRPQEMTLPGQTEPFNQPTIYPRATGYVVERRVDIGSRVKKGDLLIRIGAPDLDAQVAQSRAQSEQSKAAGAEAKAKQDEAKATLALAQTTAKRSEALTKNGYRTVQSNDNQRTEVQSQQSNVVTAAAAIKVATANTQGAGASLQRLEALASFERVVAPFDGVITTRGVEVGDLMDADNHSGAPVFTVANDQVLRITVHVPQANAFGVKNGLTGVIRLPQKPGEAFFNDARDRRSRS